MKFRRLTSAGSIPVLWAIRSMSRSMTNTACGRPAPLTGEVGTLFVKPTIISICKEGIMYGPWTCVTAIQGNIKPKGATYAPFS